jgi:hypothetical protein
MSVRYKRQINAGVFSPSFARLQAAAVVQLRSSHFWVAARHRLVDQTHLKGS